ncbi:Na+/H+ antiporter NhaC family protein [Salipaludibacillus agaradhaerens]|uniref:Na+/H+ antiporter NhaC family protein n=1 Tax=Salipaludibacillus agaradhaerens TaxID=76935 RepID=UPI0021506ED7|nr:Na+/H+ antiporter NhaC family protein [Salipaludibacillus agaradhaerens]MCR6107849.1 Na+/H+ antiporter NhaC family protein [Salipaludibacillus agaradhaerens]MCR6119878.1 Na+/H+ antiporter NhaC family protein [Salipaludibacillus agaradhaerens]UJW58924.1 Na+/H+ antiporter NhaC family protein [Bacillus sp. A116_S68]
MEHGILSLLPPILALVMVIVTKRVLFSLGVGIVVGALMINQTEELFINQALSQVGTIVTNIFYVDGGINTWEFYIILFLLILGMIASLISISGGSRAFGEWALTKFKTRISVQIASAVLGLLIFIDDYFNSLTVGNVSRPLTDRHRISRAKLAYIVDSTSAPICVISPVSSWGASIITIIAGIFATHNFTEYGSLQAFLLMGPMNFYAVFTILLVFAVAYFKLDFGPMRVHENRALSTGEVVDKTKGPIPGDSSLDKNDKEGYVGNLLWPIAALIMSTSIFMVITGIEGTEGSATLLKVFENTDVAASLLYGGLVSLVITIVIVLVRSLSVRDMGIGLWAGIKSMLPAIYILIFAWTIIEIIGELGTGQYLAGVVDEHVSLALLPALLFVLAGVMAFSTGTSWGTFGIMLPIAGDIAAATDMSLMLPVLAAVLAGAIFGDHCSPISDTTILSSTGAGSHHIDHVLTQLPYALITGAISILAFLALGVTGSVWLGLLVGGILFALTVFLLRIITLRLSV